MQGVGSTWGPGFGVRVWGGGGWGVGFKAWGVEVEGLGLGVEGWGGGARLRDNGFPRAPPKTTTFFFLEGPCALSWVIQESMTLRARSGLVFELIDSGPRV